MTAQKAKLPNGAAFEQAREEKNWLVYKLIEGTRPDGTTKLNKVPQHPSRNCPANRLIAASYTLKEAQKEAGRRNKGKGVKHGQSGPYGIGYLPRQDSVLVAGDFDHCLDVDGRLKLQFEKILAGENVYIEVSPSGEGLRVLLPRGDDDFWQGEEKMGDTGEGVGWFGSDSKFITITFKGFNANHVIVDSPKVRKNIKNVVQMLKKRRESKSVSGTPKPPLADRGVGGDLALNDDLSGGLNRGCWIYDVLHVDEHFARQVVADALKHINFPPGSRDNGWLSCLFGIRSLDREWAKDLFKHWNEAQPGADLNKDMRDYDNADPNGPVSMGSVFKFAIKNGWDEDKWQTEWLSRLNSRSTQTPTGEGATGAQSAATNAQTKIKTSPDYTHAYYAKWMAACRTDFCRYNHTLGKWLFWDGHNWRPDQVGRVRLEVRNKVDKDLSALGDSIASRTRMAMGSAGFPDGVLKEMHPMPPFATEEKDWDADKWLLGIPGGYVDLKTGKVNSGDPSKLISRCTSVAPKSGAPKRWRQFITDTTLDEEGKPDSKRAEYLQKVLGYCLTGDTKVEQFWIWYGSGGNGKSTVSQAAVSIMGSYATRANIRTFIVRKNEEHLAELADLSGVRFIVASEPPKGSVWDLERIKSLSGNEGKFKARFMRQDPQDYPFYGKLVFEVNSKPSLTSTDGAVERRMHLVPFLNTPAKPDPNLKAALEAEYPQILNWMLEGLKRYRNEGMNAPDFVAQASRAYLNSEDTLGQFLSESFERDRQSKVLLKDVKEALDVWVNDNGQPPGYHQSPQSLRKILEDAHIKTKKSKNGVVVLGLKARCVGAIMDDKGTDA